MAVSKLEAKRRLLEFRLAVIRRKIEERVSKYVDETNQGGRVILDGGVWHEQVCSVRSIVFGENTKKAKKLDPRGVPREWW